MTTSDTAQGLRIQRRFTTEGVDPYDSIEWSRRDSRITNPDGSIVFEMLDAEIPSSWSQVAADIMVSKYFRKAGVPQVDENGDPILDENGNPVLGPERSARQVFDRLAGTWRHWGEKSGYFASAADADAFEDELRYMLATQMAAPNSPQWFNTGLSNAYGLTGPAQGFWYVDPATGEMTASPDSYSRPSPHACFPAGTRISTADGFVPIEKIEPGTEVLTHTGSIRPVRHTMQRQVEEPVVRLRIGKLTTDLVATANHPVWAIRAADAKAHRAGKTEAHPTWIDAGDLEVGDFVMVGGQASPNVVPNDVDLADFAGSNFAIDETTITTRNSTDTRFSSRELRLAEGVAYRVDAATREDFYGTVYNFEVEEDESYVANGAVVHNCFILGVKDDLVSPGGIMDLWVREARIFKFGSGAGSNFSAIRGENEPLSGGGKSSGVMSFLKIGDRAAGAIKSGGTTRRAAKMVILDVDHPDIETFIDWKKHEEDKARVLIQYGGLPADFNGEAYLTVSGQNSNNSVRVTNEFIQAVIDDADWHLTNRTDGKVRKTVKARDLWRRIADAAWACADPGLQFDTTINEWHTCPAGGRIRASNPCFTGDTRLATDKGLVPFKTLIRRVGEGETFQVYTHDATGENPSETIDLTTPTQVMITGVNQILSLEFSDGRVLRCTPNHRLWTANRGWVRADELTDDDRVRLIDQEVDFGMASWMIPVSTDASTYQRRSSRKYAVNLPEKWTEEFAHYLGWMVGDGCLTDDAAVTVYGSTEEQHTTMLVHTELLTELNGGVAPKPTAMGNGTYQLRVTRGAIRGFLEALGIGRSKAPEKRVPWSVFEAPKQIVASFLRGLYDADGCVHNGESNRYVGLGSASKDLVSDVQQLLDTFGIHGSIYDMRSGGTKFEYTSKSGETRTYDSGSMHDLRVSGSDVETFFERIGFLLAPKDDRLAQMLVERTRYATRHYVKLRERREDGWETTYNLTEPKNHSYVAGGVVVSNCSEYLFLDDTACNLASLNLITFYDAETGAFDIEAYQHAIRLWTIVLEISVTMAHFPSAEIAQGSYDYRTLGLGYANLGSLLMQQGIAYDSDKGRAIAGALTAILTGYSYATSAEMASVVGTFPRYPENAESMLRVIRNHRRAAYDAAASEYEGVTSHVMGIDQSLAPLKMLLAARESWDLALSLGEKHGYRNAQATVLAPTGCLVGGSLIPTERGLVRLRSLGDPQGPQWQDLSVEVSTDEGAKTATQFYINGVEPVVTVETGRGYRIQGTPTHRIKVVNPSTGAWEWKRFGDLAANDLVPLQLDQMVGEPRVVNLPPLGEMHWTGDFTTTVPRHMTPELAEFVGYFMGDGSLHAKGIRLAVADGDFDVVEHLSLLGKQLFNLSAHTTERQGYTEVSFNSVGLALWWEAAGFAKHAPQEGHSGKGWHPHLPDAVLASNDRSVYQAFLRGLFEADGTVTNGYPTWSTTSIEFSHDVQSLLLAIGYPTTRKMDVTGWGESDLAVLRILNLSHSARFGDEIGFLSGRKQAALSAGDLQQAARKDHIPMSRELIDRLAPENDSLRKTLLAALARHGMVTRRSAEELLHRTGDAEVRHLLGYFYDRVTSAELGDEQWTYDLSVPENVTYVANGFVSHNTIGLLMDCDTTGVEPDFALVKFKKLAGGGYFKIVNQSVTPALRHLGYSPEDIKAIVQYIVGTSSFEGAPHINRETLAEKGLTTEEIDKIEKSLLATFELKHAFSVFSLGEAALQRLGFEVDEYTSWDFDLLSALGFTATQIREAGDYICGRQTIEGAPGLDPDHLSVFDTANRNGKYGERFIHYTGHIKMMAAAQPFISGAISKTINMPNEVTPEDIQESYRLSWELGLKAMALYRDGSKASQPLSSASDDGQSEEETEEITAAHEVEKKIMWGQIPAGMSPTEAYAQGMRPPRFLLPSRRGGFNQEARIGGHKVYLRTGEYQDGTLGEIFIDLAKEGATLKGILSCFAIAVSKGLQYGVPLSEFVDTFTFQTFEPRGMVEGHPNIKMANSIIDYVFRALGVEYLHRDELAQVPPTRDMELAEPPKGLAVEAGVQLDLSDAVAEVDVDAVAAAARFVDGPVRAPEAPVVPSVAPSGSSGRAPARTARSVDAGTAAMQSALSEMMGDAPLCDICGHITVRNGSCYKCLNCGNSLGCS